MKIIWNELSLSLFLSYKRLICLTWYSSLAKEEYQLDKILQTLTILKTNPVINFFFLILVWSTRSKHNLPTSSPDILGLGKKKNTISFQSPVGRQTNNGHIMVLVLQSLFPMQTPLQDPGWCSHLLMAVGWPVWDKQTG